MFWVITNQVGVSEFLKIGERVRELHYAFTKK